jgi:hypothetical protein
MDGTNVATDTTPNRLIIVALNDRVRKIGKIMDKFFLLCSSR